MGSQPAYEVFVGTDLEAPVYRVVRLCPPSEEDFWSYAALGQAFSAKAFFRATSVSMYLDEGRARRLIPRLGNAVAMLDLADKRVFWALTNERTGHLSVWAEPRVLLGLVLNCV